MNFRSIGLLILTLYVVPVVKIGLGVAFCLGYGKAVSAAEIEWPFSVPQGVTLPNVPNANWVRNNIDRFVLSRLQEHNLTPAEEASSRTLIRRLYFDLIGLPPTPDDINAFVADKSVDAYAKLVDKLLDDPRYGERWARLWLDLARYADTAGYEGDPDLPHAWRYRDYVIDSLNKDKPYNDFIREQIAGDEFDEIMGAGDLPGTPAERVVAMTFLRLAPFTEPRGDETRHELLSEMTSTVGSVFLGLTVGCAKCHDHKHDNIPIADFYRMKAFFATIQIPRPEPGDGFQIGGPIDAAFYRDGEADWANKQIAKIHDTANKAQDELAKLRTVIANRLNVDTHVGSGFGIQVLGPGNDYFFDRTDVHDGKAHWSVINSNEKEWSIYTDGLRATLGSRAGGNAGKWFGSIPNPQHVAIGQYSEGSGVPRGNAHIGKFAELMIYDQTLGKAELEQLSKYFDGKYGGANIDATPPSDGLQFWLDASDLDANDSTPNPETGRAVAEWIDKVGGIKLLQADQKLRPKIASLGNAAAVEFADSYIKGDATAASFLKNRRGSIVAIFSATHTHEGYGFEVGGDGQFLATFIYPTAPGNDNPIDNIVGSGDSRITRQERRRYQYWSTRDRYNKQQLKRLKPVAMSLRHSYGPPYEPGVPVSRIMHRGEYDNPGDVVKPGFLSAITGNSDPAPIRLDPFKRWPTRSRRMALANWIASEDNPLTARVIVNRLWHWHFGQGIVRTPSDFGHLSGGPSHRELLDWLAQRFVKDGWSIKSMHRLIVNSATYRQLSTRQDDVAARVDPDNRLLWRFNRRRLEAEAIRDNVLAVSGRLNPEQYGLPIFPPLPDDLAETVKYTESKWDTQYGPEGRKRSIYIYQQRTLTMPLMQTFDSLVCEQSRPRRAVSVTPLQALAMYNGQLVNEEAEHLAARVVKAAGNDPAPQIEHLFELALGRKPSSDESDRLQKLISAGTSPEQGLISACRVMFNTNEFVHID